MRLKTDNADGSLVLVRIGVSSAVYVFSGIRLHEIPPLINHDLNCYFEYGLFRKKFTEKSVGL